MTTENQVVLALIDRRLADLSEGREFKLKSSSAGAGKRRAHFELNELRAEIIELISVPA